MPRYPNRYDQLRGEGGFTTSVLVPFVSDFLDSLGSELPAVLGISTFGTIDTRQAFLQHMPHHDAGAEKAPGHADKVDLKNKLRAKGVRIAADNDATAAALGEYIFGAGRADHPAEPHAFAYVWAGRGLNAGIVSDGSPWQGRLHPEMGHLVARRFEQDGRLDPYPGNCGLHGDCLGGLAGYRTISERMSRYGWTEDQALDAVGYYIAQLCAALTLTFAPLRIVLGGSLNRQSFSHLLSARIRDHYTRMVTGFPGYDDDRMARNVLIPAQLGDQASLLGIMEIARRAILPAHEFWSGNNK